MKRLFSFCALFALLALFFASCGEPRVTGGSDDVDNPTLAILLRDSTGASLSGDIQVYARTHHPAVDNQPILQVATVQGEAIIDDSVLFAAMEKARDRGLTWPNSDTVAFNWVAKNTEGEAFIDGFMLVKLDAQRHRFLATGAGLPGRISVLNTYKAGGMKVAALLPDARKPLAGKVGSGADGLGLSQVFVAGSPYVAEIANDGSFTFARMAQGTYTLKALADDGKIYAAPNAFDTESTTPYAAEDWAEAELVWIAP